MLQLLNSTLAQTIIIFITAMFAIYIYRHKQRIHKKEAAIILLNEIRNAENAITEVKQSKSITELNCIMPVNSWIKYKHLFVGELNQDEIILINQFYNNCEYAEKYRNLCFDIRNLSVIEKAKYLQIKLIDLMSDELSKEKCEYESKKKKLIKMADEETWLFSPELPLERMIEYLKNIRYVTSTTGGEKLRNTAEKDIKVLLWFYNI